jgi:hypothetical protein
MPQSYVPSLPIPVVKASEKCQQRSLSDNGWLMLRRGSAWNFSRWLEAQARLRIEGVGLGLVAH